MHFLGCNMLTKFQFHCIILLAEIFSILCFYFQMTSHLMTSSVSNLHNTNILNISGTRWDMTKRKTPFFFTFKGLSNSPIFQYLNFSFHRNFNYLSVTLVPFLPKDVQIQEISDVWLWQPWEKQATLWHCECLFQLLRWIPFKVRAILAKIIC